MEKSFLEICKITRNARRPISFEQKSALRKIPKEKKDPLELKRETYRNRLYQILVEEMASSVFIEFPFHVWDDILMFLYGTETSYCGTKQVPYHAMTLLCDAVNFTIKDQNIVLADRMCIARLSSSSKQYLTHNSLRVSLTEQLNDHICQKMESLPRKYVMQRKRFGDWSLKKNTYLGFKVRVQEGRNIRVGSLSPFEHDDGVRHAINTQGMTEIVVHMHRVLKRAYDHGRPLNIGPADCNVVFDYTSWSTWREGHWVDEFEEELEEISVEFYNEIMKRGPPEQPPDWNRGPQDSKQGFYEILFSEDIVWDPETPTMTM